MDAKPKRGDPRDLRRLRNLRERPEATLLLDHYDEDWVRLRWLMIRARATILDPAAGRDEGPADTTLERAAADRDQALAALERRYPQYAAMRLSHLGLPVIALAPTRISRWRAG